MNEFETGVFNSGMILNYLLRKKSSFTLYLEDGAKLTGTLLGWDADFLLIKDGKFLQMIRINKVLRLQSELEQIIAMDSTVMQEDLNPTSIEANKITSTSADIKAKFKPTLTEVKNPSIDRENESSEDKGDFKDKLDHLVRNW